MFVRGVGTCRVEPRGRDAALHTRPPSTRRRFRNNLLKPLTPGKPSLPTRLLTLAIHLYVLPLTLLLTPPKLQNLPKGGGNLIVIRILLLLPNNLVARIAVERNVPFTRLVPPTPIRTATSNNFLHGSMKIQKI